jgi:DNA-binding NarL/FixJ family response regulator
MHRAPGTIAVGICDSHEISRIGLERALQDNGFTIFATANRAETALMLAGASRGAVVLVDADLSPAPTGCLRAIESIAAEGGIPIAMGVETEPNQLLDALRAGAMGFLTKDLAVATFVDAIRAAARGEAALSRTMTADLVAAFQSQAQVAPLAEYLPSAHRLTKREYEVLERIAEGMTNRTVAADLSISVETVRTHVSHILEKLETPNRSAAAARFHQLRLAHA